MHPNALMRQQLLRLLYASREAKPASGWINERDLAASAAAAPPAGACADIGFALDVLCELGHARRNGFALRITGAGVLACEEAAP
jgi:hypothetical protein